MAGSDLVHSGAALSVPDGPTLTVEERYCEEDLLQLHTAIIVSAERKTTSVEGLSKVQMVTGFACSTFYKIYIFSGCGCI